MISNALLVVKKGCSIHTCRQFNGRTRTRPIHQDTLRQLEMVCTVSMAVRMRVRRSGKHGKPEENLRKTIGKWWFNGILWGLPYGKLTQLWKIAYLQWINTY